MRRRPLVWIFCSFAAGIILQAAAHWPPGFWLVFISVCLAGAVYSSRHPAMGPVLFGLCLIGLGAFTSWSYRKFPADHIYYYRDVFYGRDVMLAGTIDSEVKSKVGGNSRKMVFDLSPDALDCQGQRLGVSGRVLVNLYQRRPLKYGDRIILEGRLHRPYEFSALRRFSYRRYLRQKGIYWIFSVGKRKKVTVLARGKGCFLFSVALRLRRRLEECFGRYLSDREAAVMQAVILGNRSRVPDWLYALFKKTGTAHVLAISGLHVGIVAGLFFLFFRIFPLGRRVQIMLTVLLLAGYALLTGGRPSVVRAAIMASVVLLGFVLERETDSLNSLCLAGFILLLINPLNIFDIGFRLSFTSVFAIILLYPVILGYLQKWPPAQRNHFFRFICQALSGSLAAWLGVAGWIAYYFRIITPVTVFANILIIPLIAVSVALGFGLLAFNGSALLGGCFAACIKIILNLMVALIYFIEKIPGAYFYLSV